jgi:multiple sugar transport system substrate-binding protein
MLGFLESAYQKRAKIPKEGRNTMATSRRQHLGRRIGAAAAAAVAVAAWAGVSQAATVHRGAAPAVIHFWSWDPNMGELVAQFNKSHPSIKVVLSDINPEYPKLSAAIKAGNPPDVAQIEFQALPQYIATGALLDLSKDGFGKYKSAFPAWAWSQVSQGGGLYALPQDSGPAVMYYRKDLFAKYHLAVPTTWTQFATEAKALQKAHPGVYLADFTPNDPSWLLGLMAQAGANWFGTSGNAWTVSINDAPSMKVADYWQGLIDAGAVKTGPGWTATFWTDLTKGNVLPWMSGGWAADLITSQAPSTSGKWAVAQLPNWGGKPASANIGGSTDAVFKATKNKAAAETFVEWLNTTNESWVNLYSKVHLVPAYLPAYKLPAVNSKLPFFGGQNLAPILKTASSRVNTAFTWSPITLALYTQAGDLYGQAVSGKSKLSDSLNSLQTWAISTLKAGGYPVKP